MKQKGFTLTDLLVSVATLVVATAILIPSLGMMRGDSMTQVSIDNLRTLGIAHVMYAADWDGRQVTWCRDDLSAFGVNVGDYNEAQGCDEDDRFDPLCHPPVASGWCSGSPWAYWSDFSGHYWAFNPIGFPECENCAEAFGHFRLANSMPFHEYVNGRFYDPTFYAPKDTMAWEEASTSFDAPCEFDPDNNPPVWISYVMSPAAMYNPQVMRSNAAGGWQDPWSLPDGLASPGFFQTKFPTLKTLMIEHHWLQDPPGECNPGFIPPFGDLDCNPYLFNHGIDSQPAALFYDGHVRLLPNAEVLAADQQVLKQTDGVDGLWHRGTSFGEDGYFVPFGFDDVPLSHHILTTDGILGRDTLSEFGSTAEHATWRKPRIRPSVVDTRRDNPDVGIRWSTELLPDVP